MTRRLQGWSRCRRAGRCLQVIVLLGLVTSVGSWARAEWVVGFSVEEGVSLMGGPLSYRMASPDGVTGASIDAVTTASRPSHAGGVLLSLRRGGTGALVLGLEYVHYRIGLDWEFGRGAFDVVALRIPLLARLVLVRRRGRSLVTFGFGGYGEVTLYDRGVLAGDQVTIEVAPAGAGLLIELRIEPFEIARSEGRLIPGLFLRGYRGLVTGLSDEFGSRAPLCSATIGLALRYEFSPSSTGSQGNGLSGR